MAITSALKDFLTPSGGEESPGTLPAIDRILDAVRQHLGMDVAFASRYVDGRREFTNIRAAIPVPAAPGDFEPQEDTACFRIVQGRLPELMHDAGQYPAAADLAIVAALPVGAHLNVPLRLSDGTLYGSFCCLSQKPDATLTARDLDTMRAFAALAAGQIERDLNDDRERSARFARISDVIARDAIAIVYQPIHGLGDGRPVGVESLARFADQHERTPDIWFDEAEKVGLGRELELCAIRQAIRGLPFIPSNLYVAVNVSPETAISPELEAIVAEAPEGRLVIEFTEHSREFDLDALRAAIARLQCRARIAIDDVGAGYSGLRRILDLRPDILKLDMSLTRDVDTDPARAALAAAMVDFAEGIGARIVAEGIETPGERAALQRLGVGYGQGWHFSRPMPAIAAQHFLLAADIGAEGAPPALVGKAPARRRA